MLRVFWAKFSGVVVFSVYDFRLNANADNPV